MMSRWIQRLRLLTFVSVFLVSSSVSIPAQDSSRTTFKTGVTLVPITATVRDSRNRLVQNLGRDDFEVLEQDQRRPIVDFRATDTAPVSVAFLFDMSGSMGLTSNLEKGKEVVESFLSQTEPASDEAALFTFDKTLHREVAFTKDRGRIHNALRRLRPWGLTSLYDAIAETARQLVDRPPQRRAVVVITDGVDTSSALTPAQVSGLASAIDVPVYVVAVTQPSRGTAAGVSAEGADNGLSNLAFWTGGDLVYVGATDQASFMTRELLAAMRHQYFLAIESSATAGWYRLEVRTKRTDLTVRARAGYFAAQAPRAGDSEATARLAR